MRLALLLVPLLVHASLAAEGREQGASSGEQQPAVLARGGAPSTDFNSTRIPSWVYMVIPQRSNAQKEWQENRALVKKLHRERTVMDMTMYGDSILSMIRSKKKQVWDKVFRGYNTYPMSMGGTSLEELSYRIAKGGEYVTPNPKVIVLLCGYINVRYTTVDAAARMDWIVGWLTKNSPGSKVALMALLDNKTVGAKIKKVNLKYKAVAQKHKALWVDCSRAFNSHNRQQTRDGTHPTELAGQKAILNCLKGQIQGYM